MRDDGVHDGGDAWANTWVKNTRLVRHWETIKQDILLHKWYESEKAGYDIGWERASVDWLIRFGQRPPDKRTS